MKRLFTFLGAMFLMAGSAAWAQEVDSSVPMQSSVSTDDATMEDGEDWIPSISLDSRFGYNRNFSDRTGGFGGDGLYLDINGKISKRFSYSYNQRLTTEPDESFFDATCWLTLSYEAGNFAFTAGKDALLVGSFEYDAYDLDSYYDMNTLFYNSFSAWQWGVSASWTNNAENSTFILQAANSPYSWTPFEDNLYAYGAAWRGEWDCYESYWTVNMWEYESGKFVKALNLGNMFYAGNFSLMVDCMMQGAGIKNLFRGITVSTMPAYEFGDQFRLFGKFGWERNARAKAALVDILPDDITSVSDDYIFYGAGLEFFPLKEDKSLRLHAVWMTNNYTNIHALNVGLTWKFNLTSATKRLISKIKK